jgi:hypothetical protein
MTDKVPSLGGFMKLLLVLLFALSSSLALAAPVSVRWTAGDDRNADFDHVLEVLNARTGLTLRSADFLSIEDLDLATSHFRYLAQTAAGVPIKGMSVRIWANRTTGETVQVEAQVDNGVAEIIRRFRAHAGATPRALIESRAVAQQALAAARQAIARHADDRAVLSIKSRNVWSNGELVREFTVRGRRGEHRIEVSLASRRVVSQKYVPFQTGEFAIPAKVFQMYEEVEGTPQRLERIDSELKYLNEQATRVTENPYSSLNDREYNYEQFDAVLGQTEAGRAQGYWSMAYIKKKAAEIRSQIAPTKNFFLPDGRAATDQGVILEGRYATINLHPAAKEKFPNLGFELGTSAQFKPDWVEKPNGDYQMIPKGSLLGRPLAHVMEGLNRPARRLDDHNPAEYIKDGFDELQVYWAVTELFDQLAQMGFNDPELSTRPFHAFLYDPDIAMQNNAYYTDDTINFTTYTGTSQNMARDNPTIWHELGHGIMDRLMGDMITLADTGGLSEGMADFVAELVVEAVTKNQPFPGHEGFRIINNTGFNLTNEVHDDGESYGGALRDLLVAAMARDGLKGLHKVSDLTMETMRLTRDNPALTAGGWFNHMLFADQLGRKGVRAPGELGALVREALASRNFSFDDQGLATYKLKANGAEIDAGKPGSRGFEIRHELAAGEKVTYEMAVELKDGNAYKFQYPVTVRVEYRKWALQGAIKWEGEETSSVDYTIAAPGQTLVFPVSAYGQCDSINREDGSCSDYAYVQIINAGQTKPAAKKRFYLRIKTKP